MPSVGTMTREQQIYTVEEVAELLKTTPQTVRRWIAKRDLKSFKAGREHRIRQSALDEFMQKGEGESKEDEQE